METLFDELTKKTALSIASLQDGSSRVEAEIAPCAQEQFGHYQCNSAMALSKILRKNPRQVAQEIIDHLDDDTKKMCSKIEIAGPGFINFTIDAAYLSQQLEKQLHDPHLGAIPAKKRDKVIVEFSSPNVAKELHVGHLRSTIIGDCLARLFEFLGYDVLRLNHIGDWGTQFGMLIAYIKKFSCSIFDPNEEVSLETLMQWYRASKKLFDEDPAFKKQAQDEVVRLQGGDPEAIRIWQKICSISRMGFQEIYDFLGVKIQERGESFYNPFLKQIVAELEEKKLVEISDGAKCIFLEEFKNREGKPMPLMIQKSDGGFNYDTTDMAALRYRIFVDEAKRIIIVTDSGQSLHFQLVFKAAERAGWLDPQKLRVDHVGHGLVLGPDGKKFKTRSGDTEKLIDLLKGAIAKAKEVLLEKLPPDQTADIQQLARVIGIGALKYADLSCHRTKDYTFSYDRMLRFEGNTAVFLLYAYVRINGIKRKTHADMKKVLSEYHIELSHPAEISLGLHLRRFGEVLEMMARDLLPNRLTDYLYELAEKFNVFFRDCRVEGDPKEGPRLILCELTAKILQKGLFLLGLETVEKL